VLNGHSIECRINAEDPRASFLPNPGTITAWVPPQGAGVRVDTYVQPGVTIPPFYDSMVAKLIVHAPDRPQALALMDRCLQRLVVEGVRTTKDLQRAIITNPEFAESPVTTRWTEETFLPAWEAAS
jgi:acetyl-CoA carboxylase biotin carboxylase subunit